MPAAGDRLPGERATRALLRRRTAAWVSPLHRHTSKGHCTLGCAVPAARVAGPLPDVLPSATVTEITETRQAVSCTACRLHSVQQKLWPVAGRSPPICRNCIRPCVLLHSRHQIFCAAAVPRCPVLCRSTSRMPSGACCSPRRESCQASGNCRCVMTSACPAAQQYSWDLPVMQELCMVVLLGLAEADLLCASLVAAGSSLCSLLLLPASLPCLPSWAQEGRPAGSAKLLTQTGLQTDSMSPVCTFAASLVGPTACM